MSDRIRTLTQDNWEAEVVQSKEPVLVDFWAEWCPPCRALAPTLETLAQEYEGRVKIGKLDVDAQSELAARFEIHAIPKLLLFRNGQVVDHRMGNQPLSALRELLGSEPGSGAPAV